MSRHSPRPQRPARGPRRQPGAQQRAAPADLARGGPAGRRSRCRPGGRRRCRCCRRRELVRVRIRFGLWQRDHVGRAVRRVGDPVRDRAVRVRRPEPPAQQRRASGYYQIIPSTWKLFDGTGPAAYLAIQGRAGRGRSPGSGGAAPARRTGSAPASSASTDRAARPRAHHPAGGSAAGRGARGPPRLRRQHRTTSRSTTPAPTTGSASMIAQHGDYHTGSGPGSRRRRLARADRLLPARPSRTSWRLVDLIDGHKSGGKTAIEPERVGQAVIGHDRGRRCSAWSRWRRSARRRWRWSAMAMAAFYPVFVELSGDAGGREPADRVRAGGDVDGAAGPAGAPIAARLPWIAATGVLTGLATLTHENAILFVIPFGVAAWAVRASVARQARVPARRPAAGPGRPRAFSSCRLRDRSPRGRSATRSSCITSCPSPTRPGSPWGAPTTRTRPASEPLPYKWRLLLARSRRTRRCAGRAGRYDEVQLGDKLQSRALDYIGAHPLAPLGVGFHNTLRMFELEGSFAWHASDAAIGLPARRGAHRVVTRSGCCACWRWPAVHACGRERAAMAVGCPDPLLRSASCSSTSRRPASASRSTRS